MVDAGGWMNVDPETLQNLGYKNVFCIGDGLNTGNAKTCAAICKFFIYKFSYKIIFFSKSIQSS